MAGTAFSSAFAPAFGNATARWVEVDDALIDELWPDAPSDQDVLRDLLDSAQTQCEEFLPHVDGVLEPPVPDPAPANYRIANVMQARAQHRSFVTGGTDQIGSDQTVTVFPMDWNVKRLLRPLKVGRVT